LWAWAARENILGQLVTPRELFPDTLRNSIGGNIDRPDTELANFGTSEIFWDPVRTALQECFTSTRIVIVRRERFEVIQCGIATGR